jgi:signal transduction histidine kinase
LRAAVDLLATQGVFRRVHLESAIDERPLALVGDSHELEQAFVNILLNAIDAMEAHGTLALYAGQLTPATMTRAPRRSHDSSAQQFTRPMHPRVDAWRERVAADQPCAKFVIADSGTGVDRANTDRVFDPFFTTKEGEGSGLGLAIVQRVVEAHNGVVWVQKAREGGAAFHVVLPLGPPTGQTQQVS